MKFKIEFLFFQLLKWLILTLPLKSAQRLGAVLGTGGFHLLSSRRKITLDNLRHAFPEKSESELNSIAKGAFRNYGITMFEMLWFPNLTETTLRKFVRMNNLELLIDEYKLGKRMIILSGHFGSWELIMLSIGYFSKISIAMIVQTQSNKYVNEVVTRHRTLFGNTVVPMGISVREIIRTLNEGGMVGIAPDQSGAMEGVYVDFFGRTVASHQGPAVFALRTNTPLQMGFMIRKADFTYEVVFEKIQTDDLKEYNDENVLELTRRHTALLERYIRLYPDHWLWMHRRWKHTLESVQQEKAAQRNANA